MKMYTDAVFVGGNTAGTSGQPLCGKLESGGFFRICTRRCIAQNGEDIYNKGFAPDVRVSHTVEDHAAGRDRAMERAKEIIDDLGADRFFFATDFPMWDAKEELERFMAIDLTEKERQMILSENLKKLLPFMLLLQKLKKEVSM
jgi:C-terminal processing protease CtpA/Prc